MLDLLLTPLSAMSISPVRNSMNSSKAASSPSDRMHGRSHGSPHPEEPLP